MPSAHPPVILHEYVHIFSELVTSDSGQRSQCPKTINHAHALSGNESSEQLAQIGVKLALEPPTEQQIRTVPA